MNPSLSFFYVSLLIMAMLSLRQVSDKNLKVILGFVATVMASPILLTMYFLAILWLL